MSSDVTARLDEIADQDEPDWAAYEELACAAIDAAQSWTEIAALLESESLQESLLGEADATAGLARSLAVAPLRGDQFFVTEAQACWSSFSCSRSGPPPMHPSTVPPGRTSMWKA